ncbi:MAG: hypothetical protein F4W91_04170 [Gemmatimonadetes bacterium]|nr:hypothetical protein [Gemmatimonadota bacterium]
MTKRTTTHLFIFLLCIYALTAGGHYGGDGFWNYLTAQSLMRDGDLVISDESFTLPEMQKHLNAVTSSGHQYSKYGPGMPLVEIPFYAIGLLLTGIFPNIPADYLTMFTTSMTNVAISTLWVLFFFLTLQSFNYPPATAKWLTGAFALGTMVFPYSGYGFPEPLVGLGLLIATHSLIKRHPSSILAGIGFAIAVLTKFYTLILLPIPLLYLRRTQHTTSRIAVFLSPIVAACLIIAYHNHLRYGNILLTGYHLDILAQKGGYLAFIPAQIFTAFYGLLFSTGRGLIFFFPLICLLPIAYHKFRSSHPEEARLFLGFILMLFVLLLPMIDWHAGSSWGPRYLLPILPFCIFPLGALADIKWTRRLTVLGLFVQLPAVLMNPYLFTHLVQDKKIGATIFAPHQMGDLLFSPNLSPIIGGYYQITSAICRLTTGQSLDYTISSGTERIVSASLKNYDLIDMWWVNVLRTNILSPTMTLALILVVICLILIAIYAARQAIYHLDKKDPNNEQTTQA